MNVRQNVAIIGANGLLGVNLCRQLLTEQDVQITAIDRFTANSRIEPSPDIRLLRCTVAELVIQRDILADFDVVVFLASGLSPGSNLDKTEIAYRKMVFNEFLDALNDSDVHKFIFASTGGAMFVGSDLAEHSETEIPSPQSQYAVEKLEFERTISLSRLSQNSECVVFRGSNFYGLPYIERSNHGLIPRLLHCAKTGEEFTLIGSGDEVRDFIEVRDVSRMLSKLICNQTEHSLYNLGSGIGTSVREVINMTEQITGVKFKINQVEAPANYAKASILNVERFQKEFNFTAEVSLAVGISQFWNNLTGFEVN